MISLFHRVLMIPTLTSEPSSSLNEISPSMALSTGTDDVVVLVTADKGLEKLVNAATDATKQKKKNICALFMASSMYINI
mmetsp:Transcript_6905/g.10607  ORF Transcript_6905/g.10607 Transcript_6905/m.10607 type:complete len:80 (+) Transcript_6905:926-1165(+)